MIKDLIYFGRCGERLCSFRLAWVGHDSSIALADAPNGMVMMKLRTNILPLLTLSWINPSQMIAAGHDCVPFVFHVDAAGQ